MTDARPPKPPEMALIEMRRGATPVRQIAPLAGISDTRWRHLESGGREIRGTWVREDAPDRTLTRMAWAAGVTPDELTAAGRPEAAAMLKDFTARYEAEAAADAEEAERVVSGVQRKLTPRQRAALAERVAGALRDIRHESDLRQNLTILHEYVIDS